jgi:hypothetical protein
MVACQIGLIPPDSWAATQLGAALTGCTSRRPILGRLAFCCLPPRRLEIRHRLLTVGRIAAIMQVLLVFAL